MNIRERLGKELLFLDGGMGTLLQAEGLAPGELPETWNIEHPEKVEAIHRRYYEAGSDVVLANTFGANVCKFHDDRYTVEEVIRAGIANAKRAGEQIGKETYVALDMGPTGKLLKPMGDLDFDDAYEAFAEAVRYGEKYGADLIHIETMSDTYEVKAAILAAKENSSLPVFVTMIFDERGKLLTGGDVPSVVAMLEGLRVDALGLNCGLGPKQMLPILNDLRRYTSLPIIVKPNAGLPKQKNGETYYDVEPDEFARIMQEVVLAAPDYSKAQNLSGLGWSAVGFALLSMIIYICALLCSHIAAFHVQANMRSTLMRHILTLPMGFMDSEGSGKIRKIVNESTAATETYLAHQMPDKAGAMATPVGLLVLLVAFDWKLGLLSLVPVVFAFLIMGAMTGQRMKDKMTEYQNALEEMSSEAVEYVRGIPVVKTFGQSVFSFKRFQTSIKKYEKWTIAYTKELMWPMVGFTTLINAIFAVLIGAAYWFGGASGDPAVLINLLFYIIITPVLTVTLGKIMYGGENQMIVEDSLKRTDGILSRKPLPEADKEQNIKDHSIALQNVSFRYENAGRDALHQINLDIKEGEHVAFVGPSGGGKTTLASLIARFYDTTEGKVCIGGVDVKDIPSAQLMNMVSFVFQDSKLLKTSIFENVRMGRPSATREEVLAALHNAQCDDILNKFPHGVDTVIGSKGVYLSGGEQQRIAIARVMLKNAPVLVLDEATAFADPENEAAVQRAFERLANGRTVIMIAHRLTTVQNADKIYVLKGGKIAEEGTHVQLMSEKGIYSNMYEEYRTSIAWKVGGAKC